MKKLRQTGRPKAPATLSAEARKRWQALVTEYDIADRAGFELLQAGLEAFDRMREAQKAIATEGATFKDRFNQPRPHPLLPVERDSRAQWLAALKALNLDLEPLHDKPGRPGGK